MYTPKNFQNTDAQEIQDFIRKNGFGILVSTVENKLWATHIPLVLSDDGTKLIAHISRANKQWKDFRANEEVMVIFNGPHSYISSSWYNHENVPTWNYIAVHVYGTIQIIEGDRLYQSLKQLVDKYEKNSACPVDVERMSTEYVHRQMQGITGFEIEITRTEATYKLSQNRDQVNHESITTALEKTGDHQAAEVGRAMKIKGTS